MNSARIVLIKQAVSVNRWVNQVFDTLVLPVLSSRFTTPSQFLAGELSCFSSFMLTHHLYGRGLIRCVVSQDGPADARHLVCYSYDGFVPTAFFTDAIDPSAQRVIFPGSLKHNSPGPMD